MPTARHQAVAFVPEWFSTTLHDQYEYPQGRTFR